MTDKQKDIFIKTAQMGIICGLNTPQEWYDNWMMHIPYILDYNKVNESSKEVCNAFAQFYREADALDPELTDIQVLNCYFKY